MRSRHFFLGAMFLAMLPGVAAAADLAKSGEFNPDHQTVEFFQAMKDGQLDVKFIPMNDAAANVLIENKTDKPLNVKLPEAFAGVPVLAQMGMGGMGGGGGGGGQGMGGGMGGMGGGGMGGGGMGGGGGIFNVAPEKVGKIKVACVCLDHGKPDPTPRMAYKIVPADQYIKRPEVIELMKVFGHGKIDRAAAQAATWHMNNDMSWQELAHKRIFSRKYEGGSIPYFKQNELQLGYRLALYSKEKAKDAKPASPGDAESVGTTAAELKPIAAVE